MGEMASRSRARKDIVTSFRRLRRMAMDVKSARKSLAAHHSLLAELVSVALYPSSKDSDEPQAPKPFSLSASPSRPPSRNPSPPLQQNVRIEKQSSLPCSFAPSASKNLILPSIRSLSLKASSSLSSLAPKNGEISFSQEEEAGFHSSKILRSAASYDPSKPFSHRSVFWASPFLVFLCFFLYTGKQVAVVVVVNAYIIIWIARRLQIVASHSRKAVGPVLCDEDDHVQEIAVSNFSKISTIPASQGVGSCSSKSRRPLQEVTKWDLAGHSEVSDATCNGSQSFAKLSMILVLALGGLACSHFAAVCLCSFCILLLSILQGSTTTRRRRLRLNR